jgi:hypothetical protein
VCGWVDQRSCAADQLGVVTFAGEVEGDLLHVGAPVDFGVFVMSIRHPWKLPVGDLRCWFCQLTWNFVNNQGTESCISQN